MGCGIRRLCKTGVLLLWVASLLWCAQGPPEGQATAESQEVLEEREEGDRSTEVEDEGRLRFEALRTFRTSNRRPQVRFQVESSSEEVTRVRVISVTLLRNEERTPAPVIEGEVTWYSSGVAEMPSTSLAEEGWFEVPPETTTEVLLTLHVHAPYVLLGPGHVFEVVVEEASGNQTTLTCALSDGKRRLL
jgi:hypothetical protein